MKRQKENVGNKKGITLIALVVTIVVLLILAGITISTLFGDNGIISAARRAEQDTKQGEVDTDEKLQNIEDQMHGQLGIDTSSLAKLISANNFITTEQGNQIVADKTGKTMIVPVGFKIAEDSSNEIDKGVVIEDKIGNQYVWVPVSDSQFNDMFGSSVVGTGDDAVINYFGKLYDFSNTGKSINTYYREPSIATSFDGNDATEDASYFTSTIGDITGSAFQIQLQDKFNEMAKSVERYDGFYIGRYEVSSLNTANPKTVKYADPNVSQNMSNITWYNMYKNMQGMETYANSGVQSDVKTNMIWGCQWDRTIDWIATTNTNIGYTGLEDSTSWGNYQNSTFEYKATSGATTTTEKANGTSKLIPTGSTEYTKSNNIYDLAGNLWEWTMGKGNTVSYRAVRGGNYYYSGSASSASYRDDGYPIPFNGFNCPYRFSSHFICNPASG